MSRVLALAATLCLLLAPLGLAQHLAQHVAQHGEHAAPADAPPSAVGHGGPSPAASEASGKHAASEHGGGRQSLDAWKWANFALLAGILGYWVAKNAGPFFERRTREIQSDIAQSEKMRREAEAQAAQMDARLCSIEQEINALRGAAATEQQALAERLERESAAEMRRIQENAAQEIAAAGKLARQELKRYSAQLAIGMAEQQIRSRLSAEADNDLVQSFVRDLKPSGNGATKPGTSSLGRREP